MSGAPDWHGELLAPYIAESETVHTAYLEKPPEEDSRESKSTVATDGRLVRLSVGANEETVTCVPYSQVSSATVTTTHGADRDPASLAVGILFWLLGLGALFVGTPNEDLVLLMLMLTVISIGLGTVFLVQGLQSEDGEVKLVLESADGETVYSTTLPEERSDFAETVSRLVGATHRRP